MKSILIIETPECCAKCQLNEVDDGCKENICKGLGTWKDPDFDDNSGRFRNCPLLMVPQEKINELLKGE